MDKLGPFAEKLIGHGMIAFIGGMARYLSREEHPRLVMTLIRGVIGSFVGVMFGLFTTCFTDSQYLELTMAGVGGWAGNDGMEWLFRTITKFVEGLSSKNGNTK